MVFQQGLRSDSEITFSDLNGEENLSKDCKVTETPNWKMKIIQNISFFKIKKIFLMRTIFNVFIKFVMILLLLFMFCFGGMKRVGF